MTMYRRWWISLLCVYGLMCIVHSSNHMPRNGDALSQAKAVRDASRFAEKEDTVPLRLLYSMHNHSQISHDVISTRTRASSSPTQGNHVAQASFQVDAFGEQFILDVELNHDLLSSKYVERHISESGKAVIFKGGEHCYYQGIVRGIPESFVALSTCHGLHGMFFDGNHTYMIEPGGKDRVSNQNHQARQQEGSQEEPEPGSQPVGRQPRGTRTREPASRKAAKRDQNQGARQ